MGVEQQPNYEPKPPSPGGEHLPGEGIGKEVPPLPGATDWRTGRNGGHLKPPLPQDKSVKMNDIF